MSRPCRSGVRRWLAVRGAGVDRVRRRCRRAARREDSAWASRQRPRRSPAGTSTSGRTAPACRKGRGSVADGQGIYDAKCASCHGTFGESNSYLQIAGGVGHARLRRADPHDRQQAQLRDDALRLHPAGDAVQRSAVADGGRGLRADRVRAQPQRHRRRRRGARPGFAAEAQDAESRRLHDRARLHAPRRQARHRQRRVHEELRE